MFALTLCATPIILVNGIYICLHSEELHSEDEVSLRDSCDSKHVSRTSVRVSEWVRE